MPRTEIRNVTFNDAQLTFSPTSDLNEDGIVLFTGLENVDHPEMVRRVDFMSFFLCEKGEAEVFLGDETVYLRSGNLWVSIGPQIIAGRHVSQVFRGKGMILSNRYAQNEMLGLQRLWPYLFHLLRNPVIPLDARQLAWYLDFYERISHRLADRAHLFRSEILLSCVNLFFFDLCNSLRDWVGEESESGMSHGFVLFGRFLGMVQQNYKVQRNVVWYSEQLCVTPKYLSEVVKRVSGRTARQWIQLFVLIEIKTLLRNTNYSIKEITGALNFPNQSFLGKYFKNATGQSPSEYRHE